MANQSPAKITPVTSTTKRGFATASCSLGIWGLMICWWYPLGMSFAACGVLFGIISVVMGYRAGKDGEHLAWAGIGFGTLAVCLGFAMFRFLQQAFEGNIAAPWMPVFVLP